MKTLHQTGLGDPGPIGKKALFQPPSEFESNKLVKPTNLNITAAENLNRVRTTIDLTKQAMAIIQNVQNSHRLKTGKVLPLWKVVSQAIEFYGKSNEVKEHHGLSQLNP
jgi:hypothetical protein